MEKFKIIASTGATFATVEIDEKTCNTVCDEKIGTFITRYFKTPKEFKVSGPGKFAFKRVTVSPTSSKTFLLRAISELPVAIFNTFNMHTHIER